MLEYSPDFECNQPGYMEKLKEKTRNNPLILDSYRLKYKTP